MGKLKNETDSLSWSCLLSNFTLDFTWFVDICNNVTFLILSFHNSSKENLL